MIPWGSSWFKDVITVSTERSPVSSISTNSSKLSNPTASAGPKLIRGWGWNPWEYRKGKAALRTALAKAFAISRWLKKRAWLVLLNWSLTLITFSSVFFSRLETRGWCFWSLEDWTRGYKDWKSQTPHWLHASQRQSDVSFPLFAFVNSCQRKSLVTPVSIWSQGKRSVSSVVLK